MKRYVVTPQDMLANAMNNFKIRQAADRLGVRIFDVKMSDYGNVSYSPRATIHLTRPSTFVMKAIEDEPLENVIEAMMSYRENTDWRAFKKSDWQNAMQSLGFNVKA